MITALTLLQKSSKEITNSKSNIGLGTSNIPLKNITSTMGPVATTPNGKKIKPNHQGYVSLTGMSN